MVQLALTGLVSLLATLQPAIAAPQRNPGSSDPATCIADNKLYRTGRTYRIDGGDYIVRCARDSTGNAMSSQKVMWGGFATCFNVCERTKDCAGFTYVGSRDSGTCYLKSSLGGYPASTDDLVTCEKSPDKEPGRNPEPLPSSSWTSVEPPRTTSSSWYSEASTTRSDLNTFSPTDVSTTAPAPTPSVNECQQAIKQYGEVYRGGSGSAYQLSCGTDHYGGDLNDAGSSSFIGCVAVCDSKPDCIGYAYTPGNCWLKSYLTAKEVNSGVDFAINLERNATAKPRPSTTASPSSTAPTVKPTPKAGSCGFIDGKTLTSSANNRYTIECGADHNGGDIGGGPANTFTDCADICDKVDKCIGYAWAGANGGNGPGTCYLKGTVTNRETNADVDYAYKDAATYLPSSSSSSTRSYPPTSTSVVTPVSTSSTSSYVKPTWTERPPPPPKETTSSTSTRSAYTPPPPPPPPKETTSSTSTRSIYTPPPPPPKETTSSTSARSTYTRPPPPPKETTSSTSSAPVTNPVSTLCRTITFSTSGTTRVSTVTDYISKSYTHIEWITSTTSNSAVPSTTSKPAATTSKPTTLSTTASNEPPKPTKPGNEDHCKRLRGQKPKKLRIQVIDGDRKFHNMWLKDPPVRKYISNFHRTSMCKATNANPSK